MMDKYLVRTPRVPHSSSPSSSGQKQYKQATIESLKGVVVVEEVLRLRSILRVPGQPASSLLDALQQLQEKTPSRDVLKSTKIGHVVNRLTKHANAEVACRASCLVSCWKTHFVAKLDRPMIEVRSDRQTEALRNTARRHLATALQTVETDPLVESIEREVFRVHRRLISNDYRRGTRRLVFALKHQEHLRMSLTQKQISVVDFVKQYVRNSSKCVITKNV